MKRYYSHYSYIYPDIYLKNHIIEMNDIMHIVRCLPFEKETADTIFHSGTLIFIPEEIEISDIQPDKCYNKNTVSTTHKKIISGHLKPIPYKVYDEEMSNIK